MSAKYSRHFQLPIKKPGLVAAVLVYDCLFNSEPNIQRHNIYRRQGLVCVAKHPVKQTSCGPNVTGDCEIKKSAAYRPGVWKNEAAFSS